MKGIRKTPVGKGNSEIGPGLMILLIVVAALGGLLNWAGINPF